MVDKNNRENYKKTGMKKINWIMLIILIILEAVFYYVATPAINIHSGVFWTWIIFTCILVCGCLLDYRWSPGKKKKQTYVFAAKAGKWIGIAAGILVILLIVCRVASSKIFNASKYAGLINITDGVFEDDIKESEDITDIALMDTESARIIGERAIGSLSDVVSQYEVSESYSTIDYNGRPMKVAALEYAGFFKYMNNKSEGIPGYVLVDPVTNEASYVELDKPIIYSPSAYFGKNLQRHVQMSYPTYLFNGCYLELDNDGNPYYICPTLTSNAGLFGAMDIEGVVICDPCTGDTEYYDVGEVPGWVDRVYDGDLVCKKYDWYGTLSGGYLNSIIGNKGCKQTTDDYGYKVIDGDVWVYTGVTSVNSDESNIGFVLINLRTCESKYYAIAGAEEYSAMSSAEGQVQHLGYTASFPSLININGIPSYIMVLKDDAGLVKMYAIVNVEKYNIVATGTTQREALAAYNKLLTENNILEAKEISGDVPGKEITISDVQYVYVDGNTYVYITDTNGDVYKQNFAENENLIFIHKDDKITVYYTESEAGINELISYEQIH